MKTKILSFILFAILLIFTSCGDGTTNSGNSDINDNPQFEKSVLDSITVKTLPTKTQYSVGETLDPTGLVLQGNYIDYFSDGSTQTSKRDIDYNTYKNELAFSPTNLTTEGTIKITVTYNKKSTTFDITVGKSSSNSEYPEWFKEVKIGDEDSPYQVYVPEHSYGNNNQLVEGRINQYLDQYQKYIASLSLNEELTGGVEIDFARIKAMAGTSEQYKLDTLIGIIKNTDPNTIKGINNICAPAIEKITKNIGISGNNALDKARFKYYCWAIENYIYDIASDGCNAQSETEKNGPNGIIASWEGAHTNRGLDIPFDLYITENNTTTLNPQIFTEMDKMVTASVNRFTTQGKQVTKEDVYNILNLSLNTSAIEGMHDTLSSVTHTHTDECYNNEMVGVIGNVKVDDMVAKSKLNKPIFSQDMGRELC